LCFTFAVDLKRSIYILLLSIYALLIFENTFIIGSFYANKATIEREFCKYKDDVVPLCGGGYCYLNKMLATGVSDIISYSEESPSPEVPELELSDERKFIPINYNYPSIASVNRNIISNNYIQNVILEDRYLGNDTPPPQV